MTTYSEWRPISTPPSINGIYEVRSESHRVRGWSYFKDGFWTLPDFTNTKCFTKTNLFISRNRMLTHNIYHLVKYEWRGILDD